ncbi:hypothetical protein TCAL_12342 [Tigriopus californicus]|uniref:Uncharacterized protein n=1 Tax=Tigriopus californicus TaxID=6832 RepID=A0A553PKQ0_TIGCA|nr:uncharacterized protein LOC131890831 [Tigriopus californicus]TRY78265.1 hypothetical protein TCAL_12342 [Tigriopus californicus]|eukprot:TCALIF_12342-PA protein Name:"Protein of unknown function" AED:0.00 eAED:0.00 QI:177/1/1/1/1/1/2/170/123
MPSSSPKAIQSRANMQSIVVFLTLLGLSLATPQGDESASIMETPEYATLTQAKIVELYEFLKAELEGEDLDDMEPMGPVELGMDSLELGEDEITRKKRSAEAKPFFWRWLFGHRRRYRKHYYH